MDTERSRATPAVSVGTVQIGAAVGHTTEEGSNAMMSQHGAEQETTGTAPKHPDPNGECDPEVRRRKMRKRCKAKRR